MCLDIEFIWSIIKWENKCGIKFNYPIVWRSCWRWFSESFLHKYFHLKEWSLIVSTYQKKALFFQSNRPNLFHRCYLRELQEILPSASGHRWNSLKDYSIAPIFFQEEECDTQEAFYFTHWWLILSFWQWLFEILSNLSEPLYRVFWLSIPFVVFSRRKTFSFLFLTL